MRIIKTLFFICIFWSNDNTLIAQSREFKINFLGEYEYAQVSTKYFDASMEKKVEKLVHLNYNNIQTSGAITLNIGRTDLYKFVEITHGSYTLYLFLDAYEGKYIGIAPTKGDAIYVWKNSEKPLKVH